MLFRSAALGATIYVEFPGASNAVNACKNAWLYFAIIFSVCVLSLFIPKCCNKTDALRRELKIKKEEKLTLYVCILCVFNLCWICIVYCLWIQRETRDECCAKSRIRENEDIGLFQ